MERIELTLDPQQQPGLSTIVTVTPETVRVRQGYAEPVEAAIDVASWKKLKKQLVKSGVGRWDGPYHNFEVLDGMAWRLEVTTTDIKVTCFGMNAYPPKGYGPHWPPQFRHLVAVIEEIAGDAASHFRNTFADYR